VVGGAIAQGLAWQWIFWINLPIAVIPMVTRRIDESFGPSTALDMQGLALVTGSALGLVWGLMRGNSAGWSSPEVLLTLGAGLLLAATFVAWELRARAPMVPMRFFQARAFAAGIGASFFFYASMYGVLFFLPQFLQACPSVHGRVCAVTPPGCTQGVPGTQHAAPQGKPIRGATRAIQEMQLL
jgi:MFS family permease